MPNTTRPLLSILICSLKDRALQREELVNELYRQITGAKAYKSVEALVEVDNGEEAISDKRNRLLDRSTGEYVVFVDDDDWIADTYVADILRALETHPDCVGIAGTLQKRNEKIAYLHSLVYKDWSYGQLPRRWPIDHTCPVKSEIAMQVRFPVGSNSGEDKEYAYGIRKLMFREVLIEKALYFYRPSFLRRTP